MAPGGEAMRLLLIGLIGCSHNRCCIRYGAGGSGLRRRKRRLRGRRRRGPAALWPRRSGQPGIGEVSVGTIEGWINAVVNRPLAAGSTMRTGAQARAEIDLGTATIDLSPDTELAIIALNDRLVEVTIVEGRIGLALRQLDSDEKVDIEVSGQGVQAGAARPVRYRSCNPAHCRPRRGGEPRRLGVRQRALRPARGRSLPAPARPRSRSRPRHQTSSSIGVSRALRLRPV